MNIFRTIANYMMWRVSAFSSFFLTEELRKRQLVYSTAISGKQEQEPRWKECVDMTSGRYGVLILICVVNISWMTSSITFLFIFFKFVQLTISFNNGWGFFALYFISINFLIWVRTYSDDNLINRLIYLFIFLLRFWAIAIIICKGMMMMVILR